MGCTVAGRYQEALGKIFEEFAKWVKFSKKHSSDKSRDYSSLHSWVFRCVYLGMLCNSVCGDKTMRSGFARAVGIKSKISKINYSKIGTCKLSYGFQPGGQNTESPQLSPCRICLRVNWFNRLSSMDHRWRQLQAVCFKSYERNNEKQIEWK